MSLKTIIKKWLDGDNSAAQQQNIIDVLNKQQQAILQQFAQMQRPEPQTAQASETPEVATLKQQLSVAQEQIRDLQAVHEGVERENPFRLTPTACRTNVKMNYFSFLGVTVSFAETPY